MGTKLGETRVYFPQVKAAREALKAKALEIYESYMELAKEARASGNLEVAEDIYWKLIEHMPAEEGERLIDSSAAKPIEIKGSQGPTIQIGIQLGDSKPKELGPKVFEAEIVKSE